MNLLNSIATAVCELVLAPFASWPTLALLVVSVMTGIAMTFIFGRTSNQSALRSIVDRSRGHVLAMKLFKDDLAGMFGSLARILGLVTLRLWYSLVPVLVMTVPLVFLLAQLALRYEHRPLQVGESVLVAFELTPDAWLSHKATQLEAPSPVTVETPPLRDEQAHKIYWRIRCQEPGVTKLRWQAGSVVEKTLVVADTPRTGTQVSRLRPGRKWFDRLLHPGEPAFGLFSPVESIEVFYPRGETPLFGWSIPWWLTFLAVSMLVAVLMQPIFNVKF